MLLGYTDGLSQHYHSKDHLLSDLVSELDIDETADCSESEQVLYKASFEEFGRYSVQYDTVIWLSISLLLVLAWGFGVIMLLYLPYRRYVLQKDFSSRKLYVTPREIVYMVSRPSFIPFWGTTKIEKHIHLSVVIDIIIEQGCLQSMYGIHTFRVQSVAHGKAASVDELQVQGISDPDILRKIIIREAAKVIKNFGRSWNTTSFTAEAENVLTSRSMEGPTVLRSPSKGLKTTRSLHYSSNERRNVLTQEFLLQKLEEVNKSVKKIEELINEPRVASEIN